VNLLVVAEQPGQSSPYIKAACSAGWQIGCETTYEQLSSALTRVHAEAAVLITRRIDDVILKAVRMLNSTYPLPVVLYTEDSLQRSIRAAVMAGVSIYVADCHNINRIAGLLEVATIRFTESQHLKQELRKARTSLAERSAVEKAKGMIMRQRKISEDAAYKLLCKLAMDRNRRIGEVARDVITAAEVLI
jgi:response regulator NasT